MEAQPANRLGALLIGALAGVLAGALLADSGLLTGQLRRRGTRRPPIDPPPTPRRSTSPVRPLRSEAPPRRAPLAPEAELESRVLETFRNDPILMDRPIDIGAIGTGIIELTGWVDAPDEVRHATTLTRGTIGVSTVVNRLLVRGEPLA